LQASFTQKNTNAEITLYQYRSTKTEVFSRAKVFKELGKKRLKWWEWRKFWIELQRKWAITNFWRQVT